MANHQFVDDMHQLKRWLSVKHHIPGRIRIKFQLAILTKVVCFNQFTADIEASPLIKDYHLNMTTSTLLVEYDHHIIPAHLIDALLQEDDVQSRQALLQLTDIITRSTQKYG